MHRYIFWMGICFFMPAHDVRWWDLPFWIFIPNPNKRNLLNPVWGVKALETIPHDLLVCCKYRRLCEATPPGGGSVCNSPRSRPTLAQGKQFTWHEGSGLFRQEVRAGLSGERRRCSVPLEWISPLVLVPLGFIEIISCDYLMLGWKISHRFQPEYENYSSFWKNTLITNITSVFESRPSRIRKYLDTRWSSSKGNNVH